MLVLKLKAKRLEEKLKVQANEHLDSYHSIVCKFDWWQTSSALATNAQWKPHVECRNIVSDILQILAIHIDCLTDRCQSKKSKYTCPRCNILYCSLTCYKAPEHLKCSEDFYQKCVEEEIRDQGQKGMTRNKMQEILERVYNENESMDSDDSSDSEELSKRLAGVDLDSPTEVWSRLTAKERQEFETLLESGKINEFIPDWEPWWLSQDTETGDIPANVPKICEGTPPLSTIMVMIQC